MRNHFCVTEMAACQHGRVTLYWTVVVISLAAGAVAMYGENSVQFHLDTKIHPRPLRFKPEHSNWGYVTNCGQVGNAWNISWHPKNIDPHRNLKFDAAFVMPVTFRSGRLKVSVWYEGSIMFSFHRKVACGDLVPLLRKNFPDHTPLSLHLSCPITKGQLLSGSYVYRDTSAFVGEDGEYRAQALLSDDKGRELLCFEVNVTILPLDYY